MTTQTTTTEKTFKPVLEVFKNHGCYETNWIEERGADEERKIHLVICPGGGYDIESRDGDITYWKPESLITRDITADVRNGVKIEDTIEGVKEYMAKEIKIKK